MIRRVSLLVVLAIAVSGVQAQEAAKGPPKLKLGPALEAKKPATINVAPDRPVPELAIPDGSDLDLAWNDHFVKHTEDPAAIRQAVRKLIDQARFDHVVAMINAALRNGQGQPWMHEALGLAMQALGSPQQEIERALMSAIDLQQPNPVNLMYAARYLAANGSPQRALGLYQQAAELVPTRPEPYEYGLVLAERMGDIKAIKWATIGILSQAWNGEQTKLWQKAHNVARATLDQLRAARRLKEANDFNRELNDALVRDVIAIVSWTGEADIDLSVEDPSGSVCTHRNPRTAGGGVLVGDSFARQGTASNKPIAESYYCPEGFGGEYKLRLRRVWGKLTAGKVTVDLYTHWGTSLVKHVRREVPVGDEDSLVLFKLDQGRRAEPINDQLIATAAQQQNQVRRGLLMQQLDSLASATPLAGLLRSREFAGTQYPFYGPNGAVGYQPVIIVLSEGATLSAQAVISADRRYVRFTGVPMFTGIGDVTTFNIQSGSQTTQPFQGGGAQGGGGLGGGGNPFPGGGGGGGGVGGGGAGVGCNIDTLNNVNVDPAVGGGGYNVVDLPAPANNQFAYIIPRSAVALGIGSAPSQANAQRQEAYICTGAGLGNRLRFDSFDRALGAFQGQLYLINGGLLEWNINVQLIPLPTSQAYRIPAGMRIVFQNILNDQSYDLVYGYDPTNALTPEPIGDATGRPPGSTGMTFPNGGILIIYP